MEAMFNNSVELLEHAIDYAKKQGFRVRCETLDGTTSGLCRVGNTTTLFLDQSTTASQQLSEIMAVLKAGASGVGCVEPRESRKRHER